MHTSQIKVSPVAPLLLLCLLWALDSLRSDLMPGSVSQTNTSPLLSQAATLAVFAIIATATAFVRKAAWPHGPAFIPSFLVGAGLFALPALLIQFDKGNLNDSTRVALFSLVPVLAVVLEPHLGSATQSPQHGALVAALVAVAGTLLIFPLELPRTLTPVLAFGGTFIAVASVAAANCIAVKFAQSHPSLSLPSFAGVAAGSAAVLLAIAGLSIERPVWPASPHVDAWAIPDLLGLGLLFWLMRRMSAVHMTTRFLIAPLVANLIALAFLHPGVQSRAWLGLLLIALGSAWLLFAPEDEPEKSSSPLGIS